MATVLEPRKSSESKPDRTVQPVEQQLSLAERRIRRLDLTVGILGLIAGTIVFSLVMVLLDRALELSDVVRQGCLYGFLGLTVIYAIFFVVRPLRRTINPYYAARQVEQTIPDAKNSIVNYLDLKDENLSPAIKQAVVNRASKDIKHADIDEAIRGKQVVWLGSLTAGLFLAAIIVLLILRPTQFFSLLARAFSPFDTRAIATRTRIKIAAPEKGDATIVLGQSLLIQATVDGRIPDPKSEDAMVLRLRYDPTDPATIDLPLEPGNDNRTFQLRIPPKTVQNGFSYSITGGDDKTPEYRITVKSLPLFESFEVRYDYPAYLRWDKQTTNKVGCQDPIQAIRGTKATLIANTNRVVREGNLRMDGQPPITISGQKIAGSPQSLKFDLRLDRDATYRVFFTSENGESNVDPKAYQIRVVNDGAPRIDWIEPKQDEVSLPANDMLKVEALATDDFGINKMSLKLRVIEPQPVELEAKPYRKGKSFLREEDQSYPRRLEYKDFVELAKVKSSDGKAFTLQEGMVVEYWAEAIDNSLVLDDAGKELIAPNVGKSIVRRVRILAPNKEDQQQQDQKRDQLQQDQQKHEQKQDKQNKNENRDPEQPNREEEKQENQPNQPNENQPNQPMDNMNPMQNMGNMGNQPMPNPNEQDPMKNPMQNMGNMGNQPMPMQNPMNNPMQDMGNQGNANPDRNAENQANKIEKEIDNQPPPKAEPKENNQAEGDNQRENPAEPKQNGMGGMNNPPMENPGEAKQPGDPMMGQGNAPAEQKNPGNVEQPPQKAEGKNKGEGQQQDGGEGEPKTPPVGGVEGGEQKNKGKPEPQPNPMNMGDGNDPPMNMNDPMMGDAQAKNEPGQGKQRGKKQEPMNGQDMGDPMPMNARNQGEGQDNQANPGQPKKDQRAERGQPKEAGDTGDEKNAEPNAGQAKAEKSPDRAQAKKQPNPGQNGEPQAAEPKQGGEPMEGAQDQGMAKQGGEPKEPMMNPMGNNGKQVAKGQPKQEKSEPKSGQNGDQQANEEMKQLAKDLKSDDPMTRENAQKKLDKLRQDNMGQEKEPGPNAENASEPKPEPMMGQEGENATAKKGPPMEGDPMKSEAGEPKAPMSDSQAKNEPGQPKDPPKDQPQGPPGECKECKNPGAGGQGKKQGAPKQGPMGEPNGEGVAKKNPQQGKQEPGMGDPMQGEDIAKNNPEGEPKENPQQPPKGQPKGQNPGNGTNEWGNPSGRERTQAGSGGDNPQLEPTPVDQDARRRATDLQLEKFKQNVNNEELLKKLNMTKEEYQRFIDGYEKMVKRASTEPAPREDMKTGPRTGGSVANQGTRRVEVREGANTDTSRVGPVFAPSEFRNPFKEFSEDLSRVRPTPKK